MGTPPKLCPGIGGGQKGLWNVMSPSPAWPLSVMLRWRPESVAVATGPQCNGCCRPRTRGIVAFDALKATQVLLPFWDLLLGGQSPTALGLARPLCKVSLLLFTITNLSGGMCCLSWVILGVCPILYDPLGYSGLSLLLSIFNLWKGCELLLSSSMSCSSSLVPTPAFLLRQSHGGGWVVGLSPLFYGEGMHGDRSCSALGCGDGKALGLILI